MEQKLNQVPDLNVLYLRAGYFMENLLMSIAPMRSMGILPGGMTGDLEPALVQMGLPKSTAALLIEMWKGANAGLIAPQEQRTAKNTTPTTLESFAEEVFAPEFLSKTAGG
jgi:hypothetical protein